MLDTIKKLNLIIFGFLLMFSFNISSVMSHGYHADEEINLDQNNKCLVNKHSHH
mgnify:CR=1 FL=1